MLHRERLDLVRRELARLADAERDYLATQPYRLVHEHDMRGGRYVVRAVVQSPVPTEVLGLVQAVSRELRGALDALATTLAGRPTKYPVFESLPMFAQRARKALAPMGDEAQAAIEALQPYHAIGGFANGPLWLLEQLATADRPRLAAGAIREGAVLGVNTRRKVELGELHVPAGAFDDGDVVAAVTSTVVGPDPKLDLFLRADFALAFERRGPARGGEVLEVLAGLCEHVAREVVAPLEATLTQA